MYNYILSLQCRMLYRPPHHACAECGLFSNKNTQTFIGSTALSWVWTVYSQPLNDKEKLKKHGQDVNKEFDSTCNTAEKYSEEN